MRGKGMVLPETRYKQRITPAHAGKKTPPTAAVLRSRDHPRICGEKKKAEEMGATTKGSPPRMRGKVAVDDRLQALLGITPACAGKSHPP